jgi:hypothetical protein
MSNIELSVVMPCLNEADTLAVCIRKAISSMTDHAIHGEVVVADNGSTDGSIEIAEAEGARVVPIAERGYGAALQGGIEAAQGQFVIMGDADDSYDFLDCHRFVEQLREGHDLVMGCRLPSGGGTVAKGAMPFLHRWWGNPMFSAMVRSMFKAPIHDVYCGLRGFTKELYERLDLRCTGMEFATEMVIKSSLFRVRIAEVPITLHPDGRKAHAPHLKTFTDGWRTLRFFMLYSPTWLYMVPGVALLVLGAVLGASAWCGVTVRSATLGVHSLLAASLLILMGYQAVMFWLLGRVFAVREHLIPPDDGFMNLFRWATLERGLVLSLCVFFAGIGLLAAATVSWWRGGFGPLDYARSLRVVIPAVTLAALGFQSFMSSCFVSILGMKRK